MLAGDLNGQHGRDCTNGLVAQDVLLSRGMSSPRGQHTAQQAGTINNIGGLYSRGSLDCEDGEAPSTLPETCPGVNKNHHTSEMETELSSSAKEEERKQKLRERKRIQRLNQDFAERERLRARGRIKALRQDPVFRQNERLRDKERRRKARLLNQSQRLQERERDKLHKSLMRSLMGDAPTEPDDSDATSNVTVTNSNNWNEPEHPNNVLSSCSTAV